MENLNLDAIDVDGAIREAAEEASGDTRMSFLRKGAMAGGAALSGGAILSALIPGAAMAAGGGRPPASFGAGDVGILTYALTLEYLESTFYNLAASKGKLGNDRQLQAFLKTVVKDENEHVAFLQAGLKAAKAKVPARPKFNLPGSAIASPKAFAEAAYAFENTGVHAYLGQAPNIKTPAYLLAAASIVTVEARHSGAIGLYLGKSIAPSTRDTGLPASAVIKIISPYLPKG